MGDEKWPAILCISQPRSRERSCGRNTSMCAALGEWTELKETRKGSKKTQCMHSNAIFTSHRGVRFLFRWMTRIIESQNPPSCASHPRYVTNPKQALLMFGPNGVALRLTSRQNTWNDRNVLISEKRHYSKRDPGSTEITPVENRAPSRLCPIGLETRCPPLGA